MRTVILSSIIFLLAVMTLMAGAPTTIDDFTLPGSQPGESGNLEGPGRCSNCHGGYDKTVEPTFNWQGSMMAQAARDPLFFATMTIANQDAPESGDLCLRCHTPLGWLGGRSEPTDGSSLTGDDFEGVQCDVCHKLITPGPLGENPYPNDSIYTADTYPADSTYLSILTLIPPQSGNGAYVVSDENAKRGPFVDAQARHQMYYSPFNSESEICGTCHDVSNPVYYKDASGEYLPNDFGAPATDFNTYEMFPVERTFIEWKQSAYNTPEGVYAPQFGGNLDTVRTCQDCHMRDVTGVGCNKNGVPERDDLPLHDLTGGNTFVPHIIDSVFPGETNQESLDSGSQRAYEMLAKAATMELSAVEDNGQYIATVRIYNETGHKLPSGYPEGRRIWINVRAYNSNSDLIYESGAYDSSSGVLTHDAEAKIYEIKPGISEAVAPALGEEAGPSFHFALNNQIYSDNRIPPRGFTNADFEAVQAQPVGYSYADGQYWDDTEYPIPGSAAEIVATLFYQTTSKEYVEFLRDENETDDWGDIVYGLWSNNGKSAPVNMVAQTIQVTPIAGNNPPTLDPIGNKSVDEGTDLNFTVTASDPDGTTPVLTTSTLPIGANFTDQGDGSGTFDWTPTFDQAGEYEVTFYATDDSSAVDSELITITVNNITTNTPPTLDPIGNKSVDEGTNLNFTVSASDPDGTTPTLTTSTLPAGANFTDLGDGSGTFDWTPTFDQEGEYEVTFYATDDSSAVDSELITITVNNITTNTPPVLDPINDQIAVVDSLLQFEVYAYDPEDDSVEIMAENLPGGAVFNYLGWNIDLARSVGLFEWTPGESDIGDHDNIRFYCSDGEYTDEEFITITVVGSFVCGDADSSGDVNILDITYIIAYLYSGGPAPDPLEAADVNNTGTINILDVTYLITYLYQDGPAPICP